MLFYFSCTGNTLWAAKEMAESLHEELINIADKDTWIKHYQLKAGEKLGFCFPVHGWRPPMFVRNFVQHIQIQLTNDTYCFALCTAGDTIGEAMDIFKHDLHNKSIMLHSAFSIIMPESYVGLPFMDVDKPVNEKKKITHAKAQLNSIRPQIANHIKGNIHLTIGNWPKINSRVIGGFFTKHLITDRPFKVSSSKCLHCGKCQAACPVNNISMTNLHTPTWKHNGSCLACFNCYHHCPVHAIEYGWMTQHKGQYYFGRNK